MSKTGNIVIVGGGPVGSMLALALKQKGIPSTILEARGAGASHHDQRALALSYGSRLILERLGLWETLASQATPINTIHVSQRRSLGRAKLRAEDHGQQALGYVLSYGALGTALDAALAQSQNVNVIHHANVIGIETADDAAEVSYSLAGEKSELMATLHTPLAVLADGGNSLTKIPGLQRNTKNYEHSALIAKVTSELPHENIAYERFTSAGPVALLPNDKQFSLVWTGHESEIDELLALDDEQFLQRLHRHFGDRVGRFLTIGSRASFPLRQAYLNSAAMPHLVVIGNAAQTMHPVAGQGFNIGLRDAWQLAEAIGSSAKNSWGDAAMLQAYRNVRKADIKGGLLFTDFLVNVFSNDIVGLPTVRSAGLGMLDVLKPLKSRLVSKMSFGA